MTEYRILQFAFLSGFTIAAIPIGFIVNPFQKPDSIFAVFLAVGLPLISGFGLMIVTSWILRIREDAQ